MLSKKLLCLISAAVLGVSVSSPVASAQGDAAAGEKLWKKCKSCHAVGENPKKKSGPHLNDLIGRPAGSVEGFRYSKSMTAAGGDGLVWDAASLDAFLIKPKDFIKKTKMSFRGFKDEQDRADIIAYVSQFSEGSDVTANEDPQVAPEILALVGDPAYGNYLIGTCVTCHTPQVTADSLPSINGWPVDDLVTALHAYKNKHRENPVMQQIAGALSNEEIAALAAYLTTQ